MALLPKSSSFQMPVLIGQQGLLPKKILKANTQICPACQYGKIHHKP